MTGESERAWIEVDVGAIVRNARALVGHCGARLLPMVKADAYGIGVGPVVRALEAIDPWGYGVATVAEGEEIRDLGIARPIVVFTPLLVPELAKARAARLTPALGDADAIEAWGYGGGDWHLAIDTGMLRAGVDWRDTAKLSDVAGRYPPAAVFTHFHSAESNSGSIAEQEGRFAQAVRVLSEIPPLVHTDNSAAIVRRGRSALPVVRPGIFLYGGGTFEGAALRPEPVVHLRGRIVDIRTAAPGDTVSYGAAHRFARESLVATVALGHADGYPIAMTEKGFALVRGARVPVVGSVTMDMTMLDVTDVECGRGEVATFIGRDGDGLLALDEVAARGEVSPYEFLVRMRNRLPRVYMNA